MSLATEGSTPLDCLGLHMVPVPYVPFVDLRDDLIWTVGHRIASQLAKVFKTANAATIS